MVEGQVESQGGIQDFFLRSGLSSCDLRDCYSLIEQLYPGQTATAVPTQGYCSFTIFIGDLTVVQFRPEQYRLDLRVTTTARNVYGSFAPPTKYVATILRSGMLVYSMERIKGISLREFRDDSTLRGGSFEVRATLCKDFAKFLTRAWSKGSTETIQKGIVGGSIVSRLKMLLTDLPVRFQAKVSIILHHLADIEALPWVFSHGDIVPGNIIIEPSSSHIIGLVDWAEAEHLPFGLCLYGLEEFLGQLTSAGFEYYADASELRTVFWDTLLKEIPELSQGKVFQAVTMARDLGVLLWYGIAFDDGAINRVVVEGRDNDEIHRLDAFLNLQSFKP